MTDTTNRPLTVAELGAMFEATDNAQLAHEEREARAEMRRGHIVTYLLAAEEAEESPEDAGCAQALADARRQLAAFLVVDGEYPTVEAAADAVDARRVRAMPRPGADYSEVPF